MIHCNARFEGGSLIPWCYVIPIRTCLYKTHTTQNSYSMFIQHANTTHKSKINQKRKTSPD